MAYATVPDLIAAYGMQEVIALTDREERTDADNLGTVDSTVALGALERASSEADTYLAARYPLPLASVPQALAAVVCDIARYRLSGGETTETTPIADRYKAAVTWLKDVAAGRAVLPGVATVSAGGEGGVEFNTGRRAFARTPEGAA
ncbi:gp436 family protein [Humidesulfovibrio idahonensis]